MAAVPIGGESNVLCVHVQIHQRVRKLKLYIQAEFVFKCNSNIIPVFTHHTQPWGLEKYLEFRNESYLPISQSPINFMFLYLFFPCSKLSMIFHFPVPLFVRPPLSVLEPLQFLSSFSSSVVICLQSEYTFFVIYCSRFCYKNSCNPKSCTTAILYQRGTLSRLSDGFLTARSAFRRVADNRVCCRFSSDTCSIIWVA
jgi:hypothetical protein